LKTKGEGKSRLQNSSKSAFVMRKMNGVCIK